MTEIRAYADKCKKHRRKDHISADNDLPVNKLRIAQSAEHKSCHICAGDSGYAEKLFREKGIEKAHCKSKNACAALVGIFFLQVLEDYAQYYSQADGEHEETGSLQHGHQYVSAAADARNDTEQYDAYNIIYYRSTQNSRADSCIQLTKLLERLYGYADARGGKDHSDKKRIHKLGFGHFSAHKKQGCSCSESNRHKNARKRCYRCSGAAFFKLAEVCFKSA